MFLPFSQHPPLRTPVSSDAIKPLPASKDYQAAVDDKSIRWQSFSGPEPTYCSGAQGRGNGAITQGRQT
jgi:hypothetical protein